MPALVCRCLSVLGIVLVAGSVFDQQANAASTERVSVTSTGAQATNSTTGFPFGSFSSVHAISADGRFVAFASYATNLVTPDANGGDNPDVFVHDRLLGTTERVNISTAGAQANTPSSYPAISGNGRFVVFTTYATNLVPGDAPFPNNYSDVFLRDRQTSITERVSVNSAEELGNNDSQLLPSLSADGRFVAFPSDASNLVTGDTNDDLDIFVRDRTAGTTQRVSINSNEEQVDGASDAAVISANGRFVAFTSNATTLVAPSTVAGITHIYVRDRTAGTTELISVSTSETRANGDSSVSGISSDGRFVAFFSGATNLVSGDTNGKIDVFVRDRLAGTTERISVSSAEIQGNQDSTRPAISANGRFVSFASAATNLVAGDTNNYADFFVRDRLAGTTERVNVSSAGAQANHPADFPISPEAAISADGRFVAFTSDADNLVPSDTNELDDVFVRDRGSPDNDLLVDFGANGLYQRMNNATWVRVHASNPLAIAAGDLDGNFKDEAIASLSGLGLYARYNNAGGFVRLHSTPAARLVAGDFDGNGRDEIVANLGASGIYARYNNAGAFVRLHASTSQGLAVGDLDGNGKDELLADLSTGLWVRSNNVNSWVRLDATSPTVVATGDLDGNGKDEVIGFFPGRGVLARYNNAGAWVRLHTLTAQGLAAGDFDGNGKDDLAVDFGATGLYVRYNNAGGWVKRHASNPIRILTADLDRNGKDELIASFAGTGVWARRNNVDPWVRLHTWPEQGMAAGAFD